MDEEYAEQWFDMLIEGAEDLPQIPKERMFLFKGRDKGQQKATTTEELQLWITSMLPPAGEHTIAKPFNNDDFLEFLRKNDKFGQ